ncbi:MAG: NAD-dependent epimerase/dehydratase family protein [Bacteroidales bacterium]|nr:NAD-dependent epimerase/dehydratase family protein [Bacteroidales bacterium]
MKAFDHPLYLSDVEDVARLDLPWDKLAGKTVLLSGGTGLIGSCLVDVLMKRNSIENLGCTVIALGRNEERAKERFLAYADNPLFQFIKQDINLPLALPVRADYVIHLASNTHPVAYATEPVSTIMTNITGLQNMLDFARSCGTERFAFASSNEIYGENRGDVEFFDEKYCGYIDSNTLRAGYPESKRCGEALCQAYISQYGMDIVIPRFTRSFGPTLLPSDTKAMSQFLRNAVRKENIVLKSDGLQHYSYTYVADAVSGLLYVLLLGVSGEAYNIADVSGDITLRDLAAELAAIAGTEVVFDLPSAAEAAGFSKATKARLSSAKLQALGWKSRFPIKVGLHHTVESLLQAE